MVGGPGGAISLQSEGPFSLDLDLDSPHQVRRVLREVTLSESCADVTTSEIPPVKVWTGGRWKIRNLFVATRVASAVLIVVLAAAVMVPSVSYVLVVSGHRKVRPLRRRPLRIVAVPHWTYEPVPAAYEAPPVPVTEAAVPPLQPPTSCPVTSEMLSPVAGIDQLREEGNSVFTAVKKVPRFAVASSALAV